MLLKFIHITDKEKIEAAAEALEGDALWWYRWEQGRRPIRDWEEMKWLIRRQFKSSQRSAMFQERTQHKTAPLKEITEELNLGQREYGFKKDNWAEIKSLGQRHLNHVIDQNKSPVKLTVDLNTKLSPIKSTMPAPTVSPLPIGTNVFFSTSTPVVSTLAESDSPTGIVLPFGHSGMTTEAKYVEKHHEALKDFPGNSVGFIVKNVSLKNLKLGYVASNSKDDPTKGAASFTSQVIIINQPDQIRNSHAPPILDCHTSHIAAIKFQDHEDGLTKPSNYTHTLGEPPPHVLPTAGFWEDGLRSEDKFDTEAQEIRLSNSNKTFDWSLMAKIMGKKPTEAARLLLKTTGIINSLVDEAMLLQSMISTGDIMPGTIRLVKHLLASLGKKDHVHRIWNWYKKKWRKVNNTIMMLDSLAIVSCKHGEMKKPVEAMMKANFLSKADQWKLNGVSLMACVKYLEDKGKMEVDKELAAMQQLFNKKTNDGIFVKLGHFKSSLSNFEKEYYEKQFATVRTFNKIDTVASPKGIDKEDLKDQFQQGVKKISTYANILLLAFKKYDTSSIAIAASILHYFPDLIDAILWCGFHYRYASVPYLLLDNSCFIANALQIKVEPENLARVIKRKCLLLCENEDFSIFSP